MSVYELLVVRIFSFMVLFDASKPDDDPGNFYMEREWRVLGNVEFSLSDVSRVIIPESYATSFRDDAPEYVGQLTFAD